MSSRQQFADAGHWELAVHRVAHARLPLASAMHTDPALQQTAPHALASAQHDPPTHVWPDAHAPDGFAALHGDVGVTHAPLVHVCPLGHAPVGLEGLHCEGAGVMHVPEAQTCPEGQSPVGTAALHGPEGVGHPAHAP